MGLTAMAKKAISATLAIGIVSFGLMAAVTTTPAAAANTTATYAEQPGAPPNYIFPFYPSTLCSVSNTDQFQYLMYRPLYWFGTGSSPDLNDQLSLANPPSYTTTSNSLTATFTMKDYKWSDGEAVTAQDVVFFMNMYAAERTNYCGYVPGNMPDNIKSVTANGNTVTITTNKAANTYWFTYNELSQINPLPEAWDITASGQMPGTGGCYNATYGSAAAMSNCAKVYTFLSDQAGYNATNPNATNNSLSTYATNPIWQVVDGPFHLTSFDASGYLTMAPNTSYSGPIKPTIQKFVELPYTTDDAEFDALVGGNVNVGYLPLQDVETAAPGPHEIGPNNPRLSNFSLDPVYTWSVTYFPYNFNSTGNNGTAGKIFRQLYFRQAFQTLVDQSLYIKKIMKNYAVPTYGPVPTYPQNSLSSAQEAGNPFPYNPTKAKNLLSSHGWKIVPNGSDVCESAGSGSNQCGAGIPKGTKLNLQLQGASGTTWLTQMLTAQKSSWAAAGINVNVTYATFNTVIANAAACKSCSWQMENWGLGWTYQPDSYPTGEVLFGNGSVANYGSYGPAVPGFSKNQSLINATIATKTSLTTWENYLAKQNPVVWEPDLAAALTEIQHGLSGVNPQNVYWAINPENWRWSS